jgi:hypothetical protein
VSAPLRGAKRTPKASAKLGADGSLFTHELRRDGRPIVALRGVPADGGVTVETAVYPVSQPPGTDPVLRPFHFASAEVAQRFVEETLIALEYLNCEVVEP